MIDAFQAAHAFHDVNGQTNRPRLIRQRATDGLFDPPGGIRRKLRAFIGIVTLDGIHQPMLLR